MLIFETDTNVLRRWNYNGGTSSTWDLVNGTTFSLRSQTIAVIFQSGAAYPTRPTGYASVEFRGTLDPGSSALVNDTWVNLT